MYFPVAHATCVALLALAVTGCQSGVKWPFAKKEAAASQAYPGATTPAGAYSNQAQSNVQLPSTTTQPYNIGNSYAPGNTSAAATGTYPEAAAAATAATYPGAGAGTTNAGSAYGAPAAYPGGNTAYPSTGGMPSSYPGAGGYAATGASPAAPQEGAYGSSMAPSAASAYPSTPGSYGATASAGSYGSTASPGAYGTSPPAGSYGSTPSTGTYPQTASAYPTTGAAGSYPPPSTPGAESYSAGTPVAQTADSRYGQYESPAATTGSAYSSPAASSYPSTTPAAPAAAAPYQGSAYPATPASTTMPAASSTPYRPGGTSDYVPTTPGGSVPSGYGSTASGVRPASYDGSATSMPATGAGYNDVATPAAVPTP